MYRLGYRTHVETVGLEIESRYRLKRCVGAGSTGSVWEAADTELGAPVAIKILHAGLLHDGAARARFAREGANARLVSHRNCIALRGSGQLRDGREFLVMEFVGGKTLGRMMRERGALPLLHASQMIVQVLDGLAAVHAAGLVHRDLKPDNILLSDDGDGIVKIADFGSAAYLKDREHDSKVDDGWAAAAREPRRPLCGTPAYMAPEQAMGRTVDVRADLYSVAVVLFEAIVGRVPFPGGSAAAVLSLQVAGTPPTPSSVRPDLKIFPPLEKLILRGLSKDSSERPSSASVFRADLIQVVEDHVQAVGQQHRLLTRGASDTLPSSGKGRRQPIGGGRHRMLFGATGVCAVSLFAFGPLVAHRPDASVFVAQPTATPSSQGQRGPEGNLSGEPSRELPLHAEPLATSHQLGDGREAKRADMSPAPSHRTGRTPRKRSSRATTPVSVASLADADRLMESGATARACAAGEDIARAAPGDPAARGFLGRCYMRLGQLARARLSYDAYLDLAPGAPDAAYVRAIVGRRDE